MLNDEVWFIYIKISFSLYVYNDVSVVFHLKNSLK